MNPPPATAAIVARLSGTKKYGALCPATLHRVAAESAQRSRNVKDAVLRAKRKLHQICGAFLPVAGWRAAVQSTRSIDRDAAPAEWLAVCRRILDLHASTRERGSDLEAFYRFALPAPEHVSRILDLGCGLHPFARPWMGIPSSCDYRAIDIDARLLELVDLWFRRTGVAGTTSCADLHDLGALPQSDVAFLLKLFPTLERQREGAALQLLERVPAKIAVVSFPTLSLGSRGKGQDAHYRQWFEPRLAEHRLAFTTFATKTERVYRIELCPGSSLSAAPAGSPGSTLPGAT